MSSKSGDSEQSANRDDGGHDERGRSELLSEEVSQASFGSSRSPVDDDDSEPAPDDDRTDDVGVLATAEVVGPTIRVEIGDDVDLGDEQLAELVRSVAWQGPVPPPDILSQYPEWIQHSIDANARAHNADDSARQDRMIDAHVGELKAESARADKVTDHRIQQAVSVRRFVYVGFAACFLAAVWFFAHGNFAAGSVFLGVTVLGFLGNLLVEVMRSRQGTNRDDVE